MHDHLVIPVIKVAGILIIFFAVLDIPTYFYTYYSYRVDSLVGVVGIVIFPVVIMIIVGNIFLSFSEFYLNKITRIITSASCYEVIKARRLECICYSSLGVFLCFYLLSKAIFSHTEVYLSGQVESKLYAHLGLFCSQIVELLIALYLLLFSADLVKRMSKAKSIFGNSVDVKAD